MQKPSDVWTCRIQGVFVPPIDFQLDQRFVLLWNLTEFGIGSRATAASFRFRHTPVVVHTFVNDLAHLQQTAVESRYFCHEYSKVRAVENAYLLIRHARVVRHFRVDAFDTIVIESPVHLYDFFNFLFSEWNPSPTGISLRVCV